MSYLPETKKSLGQHWLSDELILDEIIEFAGANEAPCVLEIGPGPGVLTEALALVSPRVVAVELDHALAEKLQAKQLSGVDVIEADILDFDLRSIELASDYHVVANVPYYITSKIIRVLTTQPETPARITLLVQKEVAERIAADAGQHSLLSLSVQLFGVVTLGPVVEAKYFEPPPKVDSQTIRIDRHDKPVIDVDEKKFFTLLRAGFGEKRKKLINSLSGGLQQPKDELQQLFVEVGLKPTIRAQELSLQEWEKLYNKLYN